MVDESSNGWDKDPFHVDADDIEEMVRGDSALENAYFQVGTSQDALSHTRVTAKQRKFSAEQLETLFEDKTFQKICEAYPRSASAASWMVKIQDPAFEEKKSDIATEFKNYCDQIGNYEGNKSLSKKQDDESEDESEEFAPEDLEDGSLEQLFFLAQTWAFLYGGAALVLIVEDGRTPDQPIDHRNVKSIRSVELLTKEEIYPDTGGPYVNCRQPKFYNLYSSTGSYRPGQVDKSHPMADISNQGYTRFHFSRVIRFDAIDTLPPRMLEKNNGWGKSLIETIFEQYQQYTLTLRSLANSVRDFSLFVMKIKNLANTKIAQGDQAVASRFALIRKWMSIVGGIPVDAENEDVSYANRTFSGLADISDVLRDFFIGVSDVPHDQLFGESPSGLGATGESEEKNWAKSVHAFRTTRWEGKLRRVMRLVFEAKDGPTSGKLPKKFSIEWGTIYELSDEEKAQARSTQANVDRAYNDMQVLTLEEIRKSRFQGEEFSFTTQLDEKEWERLKKEKELAAQQEAEFADPYAEFEEYDPAALEQGQDPAALPAAAEAEPVAQTDSIYSDSLAGSSYFYRLAIAEAQQKFKADTAVPFVRVWTQQRANELRRDSLGNRRNGNGRRKYATTKR